MQAALLLPLSSLQAVAAQALRPAAWLQVVCITLALAVLVTLRLDSDFTVSNVASHSNLTLPVLYKVVGAWGNHEGSMLLWVWVLAAFGAALASNIRPEACGTRDENAAHSSLMPHASWLGSALAVQALLAAGFLLFILFTSNPFERIFPPPPDGAALNPLLQDVALAMHPPLLYLGYVGFSIVFSLAVAALLHKEKVEEFMRRWAVIAHPWILASWSALTVGIGLGSWWAYRVLGWGGFWFWDPVENVSLLPWLAGTALLHSNIVLKKRGALASWVLLLAIVTFGMSLIGTFLVRAGVLTSVHSFASDPTRGLFILTYIILVVGTALGLFARRANPNTPLEEAVPPLSRSGLIVVNNLFLLAACATVLLGTLYPMVAQWLGDSVSVGPPYFNATVLPIMAIPLLVAGLAPYLHWKQAPVRYALRAAQPALLAVLATILLALMLAEREVLLSSLGLGLAAWLLAASLRWIKEKRAWSVLLGHIGMAVLAAGITGAGLWKVEAEQRMAPGETLEIAGHSIRFEAHEPVHTSNHHGWRGRFTLDGVLLEPEYRIYAIAGNQISIPAIDSSLMRDMYIVIGETTNGRTAVRAYVNPLIGLIWGGIALMALGGIMGLRQCLRRRS